MNFKDRQLSFARNDCIEISLDPSSMMFLRVLLPFGMPCIIRKEVDIHGDEVFGVGHVVAKVWG